MRTLGFQPYRIEQIDPLAESAIPPRFDEAERDTFAQTLASRPVWYVHALPEEELDMVIAAIHVARRSALRLVVILDMVADADRDRAAQKLKDTGLLVQSRDVEGEPDELTQIFLTDIDDESGLWYRIASVCYLGGTFSDGAVSNPLIAASMGCAIVHGPKTETQQSTFARLLRAGASRKIHSKSDMGPTIAQVLAPDENALLAHAGWEVVSQGAEATDRIVAYLAERLDLHAKGDT
ncbi:MAG: hypothetical protein AAF386_14060 [Pseudomonadota bacterium]